MHSHSVRGLLLVINDVAPVRHDHFNNELSNDDGLVMVIDMIEIDTSRSE